MLKLFIFFLFKFKLIIIKIIKKIKHLILNKNKNNLYFYFNFLSSPTFQNNLVLSSILLCLIKTLFYFLKITPTTYINIDIFVSLIIITYKLNLMEKIKEKLIIPFLEFNLSEIKMLDQGTYFLNTNEMIYREIKYLYGQFAFIRLFLLTCFENLLMTLIFIRFLIFRHPLIFIFFNYLWIIFLIFNKLIIINSFIGIILGISRIIFLLTDETKNNHLEGLKKLYGINKYKEIEINKNSIKLLYYFGLRTLFDRDSLVNFYKKSLLDYFSHTKKYMENKVEIKEFKKIKATSGILVFLGGIKINAIKNFIAPKNSNGLPKNKNDHFDILFKGAKSHVLYFEKEKNSLKPDYIEYKISYFFSNTDKGTYYLKYPIAIEQSLENMDKATNISNNKIIIHIPKEQEIPFDNFLKNEAKETAEKYFEFYNLLKETVDSLALKSLEKSEIKYYLEDHIPEENLVIFKKTFNFISQDFMPQHDMLLLYHEYIHTKNFINKTDMFLAKLIHFQPIQQELLPLFKSEEKKKKIEIINELHFPKKKKKTSTYLLEEPPEL